MLVRWWEVMSSGLHGSNCNTWQLSFKLTTICLNLISKVSSAHMEPSMPQMQQTPGLALLYASHSAKPLLTANQCSPR
jgi:hypothetical protein